MKRKIVIILFSVAGLLMVGAAGAVAVKSWVTTPAVTVEDVLKETVRNRATSTFGFFVFPTSSQHTGTTTLLLFPTSSPRLPFTEQYINILLLGLDSRKSATSSHCDAIHMFTLNTASWTVQITSIPRGTHVYIPPGTFATSQNYLANACELAGHQYTIKQIEKFLNKKADYVVKVNFSQTLGILRVLKLPTTESLQWLRNRKSFAIGDPQRSHNQAVFMKDVALRKIGVFKNIVMLPVARIAYSYSDTNLKFDAFYALLRGYAESDLDKHPERITLSMWPSHKTGDFHFDFKNPEAFVSKFRIVTSATSSTATPIRPLSSVQSELIAYLKQRLASKWSITDVLQKQLWLQIDNEKTREEFHFAFLERQLKETKSYADKMEILNNYIFEKEVLELPEWADKGKALLQSIASASSSTVP